MRRHHVVVALVVGLVALVALPAAPVPAAPGSPSAPVGAAALRPVPAAPADTNDGLRAEAKTTFQVDPAAERIRATTSVTLTNEVPDVDRGSFVEQYYFYQYAVPVLTEAVEPTAEKDDGTPLTVNFRAPEDAAQRWIKFAEVDLKPRLLYGESQTIRLRYEVPYQRPRADGLSRANDALVMFPAFSPGDPGLADVEVRLPTSYTVEVVGDALDQRQSGGETVLSAEDIENPELFTAVVVATDDEKLLSTDIEVEGRDVEVRAWPDDQEWSDFVGQQLGDIMPELDELVGQPWPTERGLQVIETASPYAHGYAGWYDQIDHSISLGDELDPLVIAHELSHVWFNANMFEARWVNEGLADEYAQTTMQQLGKPTDDAVAPDRHGAGAVALNDWSTPSLLEQQDDATEAYGYGAAFYVIDRIATEIGVDKMREVIDAVSNDRIPYVGDPEAENVHGAATWQRLLDQLQNVGGSRQASELFRGYVVNADQVDDLAKRAEARTAYAGLVERGDGWTPPLALRLAMTEWKFDAAGQAVIEASAVLDLRDRIEDELDGRDVGDLALEDSYESTRQIADVQAEATATLDAAEAYRAADERMDEGPGLLGSIGLLASGADGDLDRAADQLAAGDPEASLDASGAVQGDLDHATRNGLLRLAALAVVVGLAIAARRHVRRRRRQRHDSVTAQAEIDQLEALYARRSATPTGAPGALGPRPPGPPVGPPTGPGPTLDGDALWRPMDPDHPN